MTPLVSRRTGPLRGTARIPGDKSISHRSLMFGAIATGETLVHGLLEGEDVLATAAAMRAMGAQVERDGALWRVSGVGVGGLREPAEVLDMGNSGTSTRLLIGLVGTHPFTAFFTGDASLRKRPMARVTEPLSRMGVGFVGRSGGRLPLAVVGTADPLPIEYTLPVASAQVKSAILLAGLNTPGVTTVIERQPTRDYTETMLRHFGAEVRTEALADGAMAISITGQPELTGRTIHVPADPSSAAFPTVAALLRPGSEVRLPNIGINPRRFGLFETLIEMGGDITLENRRMEGGEPVADLLVRGSALKGIEVPPERAPSMIDEYPILMVAAACAEGPTVMRGIEELRVKESDRAAVMARGLAACGVKVEETHDTVTVHGTGRAPAGGATVAAELDHRIAMSFLVLGMAADAPVTVDDGKPIDTSFPGFAALMNGLGGQVG
ncbi:MAG TPA: 3-phosphoshikimate 1-carboxyvinyltransferase [Alphaproteobacteria bacterium]|nr:3-phosphoshikimate 1-carboxyvinyltransferase [Alphaproteobacteria bacterium]